MCSGYYYFLSRKFWHCYGGVGQHYACRTDMLFDLRYNGCNYADQTDCGDRWVKDLIRVKHRISWKTPGQSVEPAMRDVCINQPLQPLQPRHQWVTWDYPKRTMLSNLRMPLEYHHWTQTCIFSVVTKSRNVIYLGKEPILTRIIAGQWLPYFLIFTASIWPYSGQIICFFLQEILELWSCRQWVPRVLSPWNGVFLSDPGPIIVYPSQWLTD